MKKQSDSLEELNCFSEELDGRTKELDCFSGESQGRSVSSQEEQGASQCAYRAPLFGELEAQAIMLVIVVVDGVLDVCPDATVFLRLHVRPPKWWVKEHPEEDTSYFGGEAIPDIEGGLFRLIEDAA